MSHHTAIWPCLAPLCLLTTHSHSQDGQGNYCIPLSLQEFITKSATKPKVQSEAPRPCALEPSPARPGGLALSQSLSPRPQDNLLPPARCRTLFCSHTCTLYDPHQPPV